MYCKSLRNELTSQLHKKLSMPFFTKNLWVSWNRLKMKKADAESLGLYVKIRFLDQSKTLRYFT